MLRACKHAVCCLGRNQNYELEVFDLEASSNNLNWKMKKEKKCGSNIYKILVMVLLITQVLSMTLAGYFVWTEVNPMIDPIKKIVDKTSESLPTILRVLTQTDRTLPVIIRIVNETDSTISFDDLGRIINQTTISLPEIVRIINQTTILLPDITIILERSSEITAIIDQMNMSMPEIIRVVNGFNTSLPHIEAILKTIDSMNNLKQIDALIAEIPQIINVINFMNSSIPELEYLMGLFGHRTTSHKFMLGETPTLLPSTSTVVVPSS